MTDVQLQLVSAQSMVFNQEAPNKEPADGQDRKDQMTDDMGLLRATMVRPSFSKLPPLTSWEFYSYFWTVIKSRLTGIYSRAHYKRCMYKKGIASYLPVDFLKQRELKNKAKKMYQRYYDALASYGSLLYFL